MKERKISCTMVVHKCCVNRGILFKIYSYLMVRLDINIPPATATFKLSVTPGVGIVTARVELAISLLTPFPSLPKTKHTLV